MIQRMFVTLDTKKTNYKNVGKINHGDDLILELTVLSDGDMISFNDPMVDLLVKKSDGKMIRQNSGIEHIKPNKFVIEVSKDCVTSPGLSTNQLIINDNGRISTCMFYYTILNSLEEDIIQSISNVEVLEQLDEFTIQIKDKMENFDEELQNRMSELEDAIDDLEEFFGDTGADLLEAELRRNEAEQSRAQAESVRVQNENRRLQNDLDLANAEAERVRAENIRIQNEADRALVDAVMDQKEFKREDSELERIQNESKRATDEVARQQNENTRQSNESIRMGNETDRKTQENRRITAETNRVNAETNRRNNENTRISNENERQKTMNEMKSLINNLDGVIDVRIGVIEDEIEEISSSLDNITNRVEYIENNGSGGGSTGGSLNLRDVLDGEIFVLYGTPDLPTVTYGQIVVSKSSTTITEGSTDTFTVKLDKAPTNNQVVTLSVNNSDVTLSSYSLTFTPNNYSTAQNVTITVAEDNTDYSDETCTIGISSTNVSTKTLIVNIIDNDEEPPTNVPVSSVSLDRSSHTLEVGQTIQLTATVLPSNATNKSVTWSASNSNCTVNNGLIEAINSGTCVITCTTVDGNKTASCNITIPAVEPDEPEIPDVPSNPTLIHEWDLTGTGSTIEDKVNNLDLVVNGNKKQISRYDSQGQLDTNFILTETESFSLDILVTPKSVYKEDIIHTGHVGGVNITKPGETSYYRFTLQREVSHGSNKGRLFIDYRLENNTSEQVWIENSQTTKDVQTNIKLVYNADKTEFKVYQEDILVFTDNRPYKVSGFNFTIADYCKVYKGCII